MLVMNASEKDVHIKALGNWFYIKKGAIKEVNDNIGQFIVTMKKDYGLVDLPESLTDIEYRNSEDGKAIIAKKKHEGVTARIRHLEGIRRNLLVSLPVDLAKAELPTDPFVYASEGEEEALTELLMYQTKKVDDAKIKSERLKALDAQLREANSEPSKD